jgi:hypothetical protein
MSQLTQSQADGCDFHRGGVLYGGTIDRECRLGRGLVLEYQSRKAPPAYPARATLAQDRRFDAETARSMPEFNMRQIRAKFRGACDDATKLFALKPAAVTIGAPDRPSRLRDSPTDLLQGGSTSWPTKLI